MTDISKAKSILQQTGYSVNTVYVDDALLMTIRHGAEVISRALAVVKDDAIRSKLIALGWTPPDPWTSVDDGMPPVETPVLVKRGGKIDIGEMRWEHPTHEESFEAFRYWAHPDEHWLDDGGPSVTHWMRIPDGWMK